MIKVIIKKEIHMFWPYKNLFKKILKEIVKNEQIKESVEANLIIIDNQKMQKISKKYKAQDQATDILSFPAEWKKLSKLIGYFMLGDIFISKDKVISQAKEYNHSIKREWSYLFVHGILHLLGYNHVNEKDAKIMNATASLIMKKIKVGR